MFSANNVSVIIPSYNSRNTILACLESLHSQTQVPGEIILVDSSEDDTVGLVVNQFPGVRIYAYSRRIFPGPARNRGVRLAQGPIIAFIDADCIAAPNWIDRIVAGHNAGHLVVGGAVALGNPDSPIAWAGHLGEFREFLPAGNARKVGHIPTCNITYRKEILERFGGFPDAYYPQEDLLFNYLLGQNGVPIWFDPELQVEHFTRGELRPFLSHQHRIGRVTRSTLRRVALPGSSIANRSWLAFLTAPALGLVKFLRTAWIFTREYPQEALRSPTLFFWLLVGALWWARGFAAGARSGLSGIPGILDPDEAIFFQLSASAHTGQAGNEVLKR